MAKEDEQTTKQEQDDFANDVALMRAAVFSAISIGAKPEDAANMLAQFNKPSLDGVVDALKGKSH